jgi:hypothetical protein
MASLGQSIPERPNAARRNGRKRQVRALSKVREEIADDLLVPYDRLFRRRAILPRNPLIEPTPAGVKLNRFASVALDDP